MKFIFLLNGIILLGIFIYLLINFFKHHDKKTEGIARSFSFIGLIYLFFSISSFLWFFGFLDYISKDFLFLYSLSLILQSFILFRVIYLFSKNKRLYYFLGFYLIILISLLMVSNNFLSLSIIASFLFTLLLCLEFIFIGKDYRRPGYFGIFYATVSIILDTFLSSGIGDAYFFSFISNILFFGFIFFFFKGLEKYSLHKIIKFKKESSYLISLLGHLIFIITLTNFIFIGTIGLHELGHYGVSKFYDCEYRQIVYEGDLFHTEILCGNLPTNLWVILGGVLAPLILAALLFFMGGKFMREVALLIAGFNLISVSRDFGGLGISENIVLMIILLGIVSLILGLFLLVKSRTEEDIYLYEIVAGSSLIKKGVSSKKNKLWR